MVLQLIKALPDDIQRIIITFMIYDLSKITFKKELPKSNFNTYSDKFEVAYYKNIKIINDKEFYLSRIKKKNGRHRYYITKEIVDSVEVEYNDKLIEIFNYDYSSKFKGKNLINVLIELLN